MGDISGFLCHSIGFPMPYSEFSWHSSEIFKPGFAGTLVDFPRQAHSHGITVHFYCIPVDFPGAPVDFSDIAVDFPVIPVDFLGILVHFPCV